MRLLDLLGGAFSALRANKLRSSLTALGVIIGVGAVVAMLGMTTGFERFVNDQFSGLGSNTFQIQKWPAMRLGGRGGMSKYWNRKDISLQQAAAVRDRTPLARFVGAELWNFGGVARSAWAVTQPRVVAAGGTPEFATNNGYEVSEGRTLNALDVLHARDVVVLGADVAANLFPRGGAVGQTMVFAGRRFQVAGVFAPKGSFFGLGSRDDFALIPITTFVRIWGVKRSVNVTVQALGAEVFAACRDSALQVMRQARGLRPGQEDDFDVFSNESVIATISELTDAIAWAAVGIALISLLVGGIGIMNIMLVSVTERTREVGVRRAMGAKRRHILWQFTAEAVVLAVLGGLLGLGLGFGVVELAHQLFGLPAAAPLWAVVVALLTSTASGLVFGVYPAWRAAHLDPIESLRYE
jgi:putative ABC transport system permease protein